MDDKNKNNGNGLNEVQKRLSRDEARLSADESRIERQEKSVKRMRLSMRGLIAAVLMVAAIGIATWAYLAYSGRSVYIDSSDIEAPEIDLASTAGGTLNEMLVKPGDMVSADQAVARVGNELIVTKVAGLVTKADATVGQTFTAGQTVVAMIDPTQLRAVGHLDENKGLDQIHVGQYATFTVDAFGSKTYSGIVDEVSPEARSGDVVFTISDKRQEQVFDVKVRFDPSLYPELKDGMSARIWVNVQ